MELLLQTLVLGLLLGSVLALAASGLSVIYGVMGVVNIAHGALLILAAFITWSLWTATGIDPFLLIVVIAPSLFVVGIVIERVALRPARGATQAATVIITVAVAFLLEGIMGFIWGNTSHAVTPGYALSSFDVGGIVLPKAEVYGALVGVVLLSGLYLFLTRTWMGTAMRACAENAFAAQLVGIRSERLSMLAFGIGAASVGAAGVIIGILYPFVPGSHVIWISRLLAVVVLGGLGSIPGAVLGALTLGVAEAMTAAYIGTEWTTAVPYLVVFAALLLRPQGLLGARLREDIA